MDRRTRDDRVGARNDHPSPDVMEALASDRRRAVLEELRGQGTATFDELAATVGRKEGIDHERAWLGLYHQHVPKLAAAGIVTVDYDAGTVTFDPEAHSLVVALLEARQRY